MSKLQIVRVSIAKTLCVLQGIVQPGLGTAPLEQAMFDQHAAENRRLQLRGEIAGVLQGAAG